MSQANIPSGNESQFPQTPDDETRQRQIEGWHLPLHEFANTLRGGPKLTNEPTPRRARALLKLDNLRAMRAERLAKIAQRPTAFTNTRSEADKNG